MSDERRRPPGAASRGRIIPCAPAYALPPYRAETQGRSGAPRTAVAAPVRRKSSHSRARRREVVDAVLGGALLALCVTALLGAMTLAVVRTRC
ncbi:hypothetical protein NX794_04910 [Streptomyces sp. LP11]|uniref:Uncharacterized protein n=1 Tax=Streptomyces pyxinicus TaxID=2970331 RepID=A0ABT2AXX9_9ACTN|nr:hypothetical protein [Streptomyces sp. LP11]MCS0600573.1 hypothetical protein [Streptomyces sp. LP11]